MKAVHTSGSRYEGTQPEPLSLQSCELCGIGRLCLSSQLVGGDLQDLKPVVRRRFCVPRGESLFVAGQQQHAVYVLRSGSFKSCDMDADGQEQVTEFFLPGDVLGLEDMESEEHNSYSLALENSWVCEIPLKQLQTRVFNSAPLCREVFSVLCGKVRHQRGMIRQLGKSDAMCRVSGFLLGLSERLRRRRLPYEQFRLTMDRGDIANYLGMKLETVSRSFSSLQKQQMISVHGKSIELLDRDSMASEYCPQFELSLGDES
jgi:CRP/FNR family transcriptional regulator